MPPTNDSIRELSEQVRRLNDTILVTLGDGDRQGVLLVEVEKINQKLESTHIAIHGDAEKPGTGLASRMDRLEHQYAIWSKVLWTLLVTITGVVVKGVWDVFSHKP